MAIAPSKLGRFVSPYLSSPDAFLAALRNAGLVEPSASDEDVKHTLQRAEDEHAQIPEAMQVFNTPHERVRVFLGPYLTPKGQLWAEPLVWLGLLDGNPD